MHLQCAKSMQLGDLQLVFHYWSRLCDYVYQSDHNGLQILTDNIGNLLDWFKKRVTARLGWRLAGQANQEWRLALGGDEEIPLRSSILSILKTQHRDATGANKT